MITTELHCHTYYSDGRASPRELVEAAAGRGLHFLAITDHDTTAGTREARGFSAQRGIQLIPAMEFTTRWGAAEMPAGETDVDLLGYFVDLDSPAFLQSEKDGLADFAARMQAWCALLTQQGCPVSLEYVLAQNPRNPSTLHLIQAVQAHGDGVSWDTAEILVRSCIHAVPPCARSIEQAIAVVHAAGGVVVLAHPTSHYLRWKGSRLDSTGLQLLVEAGLDGIEVFHPRLDADDRRHFLNLAARFKLLVSGGSDEHGWPEGFPSLASQAVTDVMVAALAARAREHGHAHRDLS
jgi:predicted metal-dependent phosphoesterase TrpH